MNAITPAADAAPIVAPEVPTDATAAAARKSALLADPAYRSKFLENDPAARAEMSALHRVIIGPDPAAAPIDQHVLDHAREIGVSEEVVNQIKEGQPVTQFERDAVMRWKTSHMKDPEFLRKYFDGDYEARKQMFLANVTLSLPIKQA
jgi:hypothetical protein